ncbi:MAG: hypothetical protein AB9891_02700 [Anaerolineaceae bacterium]
MKHRIVLPIILIALILSSCSLPGGKAEEPTVPPPPPAVEPTMPPPPTAEPAAPADPPTAEPAPVEEPTAEPASASFREEFDLANEDWSEDYWVTTQAPEYREITKPSMVVDGILSFNIQDKETYIYRFHNIDAGQDVSMETTFLNKGHPNNGVALVCRAAPDYTSWYEARISPQGKWSIYRYDKALKDNEDINPYIPLKEGVMRPKLVTPMKSNTFNFSCIGTKLTLAVNGEEVYVSNNNELMQTGLVGLAVISYDLIPVQIEFDYFDLVAEE